MNQRFKLGSAHAAATCGLALLMGSTLACSGEGASLESDEGATVIQPAGMDSPGKITVVNPSGSVGATTFSVDSHASVVAGSLVSGLTSGPHSVSVTSTSSDYTVNTMATANVVAGATTTLKTALVAVNAVAPSRTLGLGQDALTAMLGFYQEGGKLGEVQRAASGSSSMALLEGTYDFPFGLGGIDGVRVKATVGKALAISLGGPNDRRVARIQAPTTRDMPAACGGDEFDYFLRAAGETTQLTVPPGTTIDFGVAASKGAMEYRLQSRAWANDFVVPLGNPGATPTLTRFARLDVDDVLINATQPRVRGWYSVFVDAGGGQKGAAVLACQAPTKTGVDLLPGKYVVEVYYPSLEVGTKTDVHLVTLKP